MILQALLGTPGACQESSRGWSGFPGDTPGNGTESEDAPWQGCEELFLPLLPEWGSSSGLSRGCRLENGSTPGYSPLTPPA